MRSSCISHPAHEPMLIIRAWQVVFAGGDHCAAALLAYLEYWHNVRLDQSEKSHQANEVAEKHGDHGVQDVSLWQFHTSEQLEAGMLGLYGATRIRSARKVLVETGAVEEGRNQNPRYHFDQTIHFRFHPEICQSWIHQEYRIGSAEMRDGSVEARDESAFLPTVQSKKETTRETTPESVAQAPAAPASKPRGKEIKHVFSDQDRAELVEKWTPAFGSAPAVNAVIDRALNHVGLLKAINQRVYVDRTWLAGDAKKLTEGTHGTATRTNGASGTSGVDGVRTEPSRFERTEDGRDLYAAAAEERARISAERARSAATAERNAGPGALGNHGRAEDRDHQRGSTSATAGPAA